MISQFLARGGGATCVLLLGIHVLPPLAPTARIPRLRPSFSSDRASPEWFGVGRGLSQDGRMEQGATIHTGNGFHWDPPRPKPWRDPGKGIITWIPVNPCAGGHWEYSMQSHSSKDQGAPALEGLGSCSSLGPSGAGSSCSACKGQRNSLKRLPATSADAAGAAWPQPRAKLPRQPQPLEMPAGQRHLSQGTAGCQDNTTAPSERWESS